MKKSSRKKAGSRKSKKRSRPAAKKAKKKVQPIPSGYHTATPYLVCRDAGSAIDFYKRAFGAKEKVRMAGPDGRVMHAEIRIGDSMIMLGEENVEMGAKSPTTLGGSTGSILLYVKSADAFADTAVASGATVVMPVQDMFWGDRWGKLKDPYGHEWQVATHKEDLSPKEMGRRAREAMAAM